MLKRGHRLVICIMTGFLATVSVLFNVFILLLNQKNCRKNHLHLCPGDTIITGISLASISHQILAYFWVTMIEVDINCIYGTVESILFVMVSSLKFSIMWSTAFLTFFYGTKLMIKPIHYYTYIQDSVLKHVLTVLTVIFLCGFTNNLPLLKILTYQNSSINTFVCSSVVPEGVIGVSYIIYLVVIADIVPGLLMIKCSISISYQLTIHLHHMKKSSNGVHTPKLGAQLRVVRMNLTLVAVFLCFLVVDLYSQSTLVLQSENTIRLTILFFSIYTTVSGFLLIYGKKSFWKEFIQWHNLFLDEYPCLHFMKITVTNYTSKNMKCSAPER